MDFSAEFEYAVGELGMRPAEFWELTFSELVAIAEGNVRKRKRRINELIYLAWHTEAFARTKKLPSLKSLMQDESESHHRVQTDDEMIAMAKIINAVFGGTEVEA